MKQSQNSRSGTEGVTFYIIHFGYLKCAPSSGYPKYCYSEVRRKNYTKKTKKGIVLIHMCVL